MAQLLYGSGLRLLECLRLRVKDLDFTRRQLTVRDGQAKPEGDGQHEDLHGGELQQARPVQAIDQGVRDQAKAGPGCVKGEGDQSHQQRPGGLLSSEEGQRQAQRPDGDVAAGQDDPEGAEGPAPGGEWSHRHADLKPERENGCTPSRITPVQPSCDHLHIDDKQRKHTVAWFHVADHERSPS